MDFLIISAMLLLAAAAVLAVLGVWAYQFVRWLIKRRG